MQINDSTAECKQLKLSVLDPKCNLKISGYAGYTVEGVAMFAGPIMTGRITFVSEQLHPVHNPLTRSCLCAIYLHFAAACKLYFFQYCLQWPYPPLSHGHAKPVQRIHMGTETSSKLFYSNQLRSKLT